jgi:hypothetical protein
MNAANSLQCKRLSTLRLTYQLSQRPSRRCPSPVWQLKSGAWFWKSAPGDDPPVPGRQARRGWPRSTHHNPFRHCARRLFVCRLPCR